jgi:hypothetical protein
MPINLKARSILTLDELSPAEIRFLLRLATELKAAKSAGTETQRLKGKNIALIFEKDSTRPHRVRGGGLRPGGAQAPFRHDGGVHGRCKAPMLVVFCSRRSCSWAHTSAKARPKSRASVMSWTPS